MRLNLTAPRTRSTNVHANSFAELLGEAVHVTDAAELIDVRVVSRDRRNAIQYRVACRHCVQTFVQTLRADIACRHCVQTCVEGPARHSHAA